jgi:small-conductance mechanosensitive channel
MEKIQSKHNIKIDCLTLTEEEFLDLLGSEEANPLKEMSSNKIAFFSPEDFCITIKTALRKGIRIKTEEETNPAKISEKDLVYNLNRFGYKEFGQKIEEGKKICIEYIITSILLQENAMRIQATPILLTKKQSQP